MSKLTVSEQLQLANYMITGYIGGSVIWNNGGKILSIYLATKQADGAYVDYSTFPAHSGKMGSRFLGIKYGDVPFDTLVLNSYTNSTVQLYGDSDITQSMQLIMDNTSRDSTRDFYTAYLIYPDQWSITCLDPTTVIQPYTISEIYTVLNTNKMHYMFGDGADFLNTTTQYLYNKSKQAPTNYRVSDITRYTNPSRGSALLFDKSVTVEWATVNVLNNDGSTSNIREYSENCGKRGILLRLDQTITIMGAIYIANDNSANNNLNPNIFTNCLDVTVVFNDYVQSAITRMNAIMAGTDTRPDRPFVAAYPTTDGNMCIVIDTSLFNAALTDPAYGHKKVLTFNVFIE